MVSLVTYDNYKAELNELRDVVKELAAKLSEDNWNMEQFSEFDMLHDHIQLKPLMDMLLYDVTRKEALTYLFDVRKEYQLAQIMVLADVKTSPMEYMKPGIRADSLLLRPWNKKQATEVLREFIQEYLKNIRREKQEGAAAYIIDSKEGTLSIPYDKIYFFEAREKKIFVCTGQEEFGFYHTIDKLVEELPEQFIRCHRGFIVNGDKIRKIMLSQNIIYLADDFDVPLSRSYKADLKGFGRV